jgi:hypothetical protein
VVITVILITMIALIIAIRIRKHKNNANRSTTIRRNVGEPGPPATTIYSNPFYERPIILPTHYSTLEADNESIHKRNPLFEEADDDDDDDMYSTISSFGRVAQFFPEHEMEDDNADEMAGKIVYYDKDVPGVDSDDDLDDYDKIPIVRTN